MLQSVAQREQRRFASLDSSMTNAEIDLRTVSERVVLSDYRGDLLSPDMTIGDLTDPGVVVAVIYEGVTRDERRPADARPAARSMPRRAPLDRPQKTTSSPRSSIAICEAATRP